jgi:hypothetical protein
MTSCRPGAAETPEDIARYVQEALVFLSREASTVGLYDLAASLSSVAWQAHSIAEGELDEALAVSGGKRGRAAYS